MGKSWGALTLESEAIPRRVPNRKEAQAGSQLTLKCNAAVYCESEQGEDPSTKATDQVSQK